MVYTPAETLSQNKNLCAAMREKEWQEMGLEEKVEKLKREVDSLTRRNRGLDRRLQLLMHHKHNDHEVLINIAHAES